MSSLETKNLELKLDDLAEQLNKKLEYQNRMLQKSIETLSKRIKNAEKRTEKRFKKFETELDCHKQPVVNIQSTLKTSGAKNALINCMSSSTGHGLPQIVKSGNLFLNIFWTVFFLISLGGFVFMAYQTVEQFTKYEVNTMTKIKRETEITYPVFTVCSKNNSMQNLIVNCRHIKNDTKACQIQYLSLFNEYSYQKHCFQLNSIINQTEPVKTKGDGWQNGYEIFLENPLDDFITLTVKNNNVKAIRDEETLTIYRGHETDIVLSRRVQTVLGPPYSQCNDSAEYSQVNCIEDCFSAGMSKLCGCRYPDGCSLNFNCKHNISIKIQCELDCPDECYQISYPFNRVDIKLEADNLDLKLLNKVTSKFNQSEMSTENILKRMTLLYIYFQKLETTEITQSPSMSIIDLIADFGGHLGLFLGFSLLSSIEALDLLIRIIQILCRNIRGN